MKKATISLAAIMLAGSNLMAGGNISPEIAAEVPIVCPEPEPRHYGGFYIGGAFAAENFDTDVVDGNLRLNNTYFNDVNFNTAMLQTGYKFNQYIAVEGRYWFATDKEVREAVFNENVTISNDTWGIYAKPMYPLNGAMDIYGMFGYANSSLQAEHPSVVYSFDSEAESFSYGAGASYSISTSITVFADYVSMRHDEYSSKKTKGLEYSDTIRSLNFGATYNF